MMDIYSKYLFLGFLSYVFGSMALYFITYKLVHGDSLLTFSNHSTRVVQKGDKYIIQMKVLMPIIPFYWRWENWTKIKPGMERNAMTSMSNGRSDKLFRYTPEFDSYISAEEFIEEKIEAYNNRPRRIRRRPPRAY